jgi:tetratricopeptide (TPR) repeat protein
VLQAADLDPWRKQAREALAHEDWRALEPLLQEVTVSQQRPALLHLYAGYLPSRSTVTKQELLCRIRETYPGEFWAHSRLQIALSHDVLAWQLANSENRDEEWALELAQEAVRLVPNDGDFWNTLGVAHYRAGNWKEAIEALEKANELSMGGQSSDWLFLAMAHWQLGNKQDACRWYDQAVAGLQNELVISNEELRGFRAEAAELLGVKEK